jgi:hemerythrin
MAIYGWSENLATGMAHMDADHQRLIEMISKLEEISQGHETREDVHKILLALIDYAKYHTAREERLMQQINYKSAGPHKFEHAVFVNKINEFLDAFNDGKDISQDMTRFLYRWLIDHINKVDKLLVWSLANLDMPGVTDIS